MRDAVFEIIADGIRSSRSIEIEYVQERILCANNREWNLNNSPCPV